MPLTLGRLGFNQDNGNRILPQDTPSNSNGGLERKTSLHFQKLTSKDLLQRIKQIDSSDATDKAFSIQQSSYQSIMNCFQLLTDLTNYSHEMFTDLSKLLQASNTRLQNVAKKISELQSSNLEDAIAKVKVMAVLPTGEGGSEGVQTFQSTPYKFTVSLIDRHRLSLSLIRNLEKLLPNPNFQTLQSYAELKYFDTKTSKVKIIGEAYSSPQFFLNAWVIAQEKRLEQADLEKKQHKADRKKREKVKQKAQFLGRRKSDIQVVRWQDRYASGSRDRSTSNATSTQAKDKSIRSQIHRSQIIRSLNFDETDDTADPAPSADSSERKRPSFLETTETITTPTPPPPTVDTTEKKRRSFVEEAQVELATELTKLSETNELRKSVNLKPLDKPEEGTKPPRTGSVSSVGSGSRSPIRSSLAGIFPSLPVEDEDEDDDNDGRPSLVDLNISKDSGESSLASSVRKSLRFAISDEDILPKIYSALKNFKVDLEDPTVFSSPMGFVIIPTEAIPTTSNRQSMSLRYSALYQEKIVSTRNNPDKDEPAKAEVKPPTPVFAGTVPRPPPPPPKRDSFVEPNNSERKVSFSEPPGPPRPPPPPLKVNVNFPAVAIEEPLVSPLSRGNDRKLITKSVRVQGGYASILATATRPPPPPPPPPPKVTSVPTQPPSQPSAEAQILPHAAKPVAPPQPPVKLVEEKVATSPIQQLTPTKAPPSEETSRPDQSPPFSTPGSPPFPGSPLSDSSSASKPSLLDAIRRGSVLRKVEDVGPSITRRNSSLGAFGSDAVNAILERRRFVEESESESDEEEEWG